MAEIRGLHHTVFKGLGNKSDLPEMLSFAKFCNNTISDRFIVGKPIKEVPKYESSWIQQKLREKREDAY